jgi:hypothetical protein
MRRLFPERRAFMQEEAMNVRREWRRRVEQ